MTKTEALRAFVEAYLERDAANRRFNEAFHDVRIVAFTSPVSSGSVAVRYEGTLYVLTPSWLLSGALPTDVKVERVREVIE
jgi:hypothetical protein